MKSSSIVLCFIVVLMAAIVGGFVYDYVRVDEVPKNDSIASIIEEERFTVECIGNPAIRIYHDNKLNVTCWYSTAGSGGLSCIPDNQLNRS